MGFLGIAKSVAVGIVNEAAKEARKNTSGRTINENLDRIRTYILIVGNDEEAINTTKQLEGRFIEKYHPQWNKMINI